MEYRDPTQETQHKKTMQLTTENKALQHSLRLPHRKYNFINHTGQQNHSKHTLLESGSSGHLRGQREYNLLSHLQNKFHEAAPMNFDEYYTKECQMKPKSQHKPSFRQRDFNILSNQYQQDHDLKQQEDHAILQEKMSKKYWETHHYDPIKVQSYDGKEEEDYHVHAQRKREKQLQKKIEQYPTR
jgi:hypothetical protein